METTNNRFDDSLVIKSKRLKSIPKRSVLVVGGTRFIGRHLVQRLVELEAFEITLFNRQKTHANLFPRLKLLKGDRQTSDIDKISTEKYDIVIDTCGYFPTDVVSTIEALRDFSGLYIFISSCSAYDNEVVKTELKDEQTPLLSCSPAEAENSDADTYGRRKAACERILMKSGLTYLILRPALVYGPHDYTDRFYYWLYHSYYSDELLLPNDGKSKFSVSFVEDLVDMILCGMKPNPITGEYNAVSTAQCSIARIVASACRILNKQPGRANASPSFLKHNNIAQWTDMPLWIDGDHFTYSNDKMVHTTGIMCQDFTDSVQKTIGFATKKHWPVPNYGISEQRRIELLRILDRP